MQWPISYLSSLFMLDLQANGLFDLILQGIIPLCISLPVIQTVP